MHAHDEQLATIDTRTLATVTGGAARVTAKVNPANKQITQLLTTVTNSIKDLARNSQSNSSSQLLPMMMMMGRR